MKKWIYSATTDNNLVLQILKSHGIDTTKAKYELYAETYERYGSGGHYRKTFTCPGDYLAYFAMQLHTSPTAKNIANYYGEDLSEFEDVVDEYPTLADIEELASSSWWGDGDDYIFYLKNLNTGKYLYESGSEEVDEYEEDEWED